MQGRSALSRQPMLSLEGKVGLQRALCCMDWP